MVIGLGELYIHVTLSRHVIALALDAFVPFRLSIAPFQLEPLEREIRLFKCRFRISTKESRAKRLGAITRALCRLRHFFSVVMQRVRAFLRPDAGIHIHIGIDKHTHNGKQRGHNAAFRWVSVYKLS